MAKGTLTDLARPGAKIAARVTPKAAANRIERAPEGLRIYVTAVPEGGKANAAVIKLLARALGVPKSRLTLLRGQGARDKLFRIEPD